MQGTQNNNGMVNKTGVGGTQGVIGIKVDI